MDASDSKLMVVDAHKTEDLVCWAEHNIFNPALNAGPLAMYNIAANAASLPDCHLTIEDQQPFSASWFIQGMSGGVGALLPFYLAGECAGRAFLAVDGALAGTRVGAVLNPILTSSRIANISGAMAFAGLQKPNENHTRLGNALGTGVGCFAFDRGNFWSKQSSLAGKLTAYPLVGFVGGSVMSEASQLASNGQLAPTEVVLQSAVQGLALNSFLPHLREGIPSDFRLLDALRELKPRPLPDAKVVAAEVGKSMERMPMVKDNGNLVLGAWNMEFLTSDKAKYFTESYKHIIPRHHLMFVEETNFDGLARVAKDNGYNFEVSRENSRGQAVGFLLHPRLKVLNTHTYEEIANVFNISDLRPAFRVDLLDTTSEAKFSAVAVHLKSMRGGEAFTAPVRKEQAKRLANVLGRDFRGIVAGDWNTYLDRTRELDPLLHAGFKIANPRDTTSTQSMGGRLDGFLHKEIPWLMSNPEVRPFFNNPKISGALSDHGLLSTTLKPPSSTVSHLHYIPAMITFDHSRSSATVL